MDSTDSYFPPHRPQNSVRRGLAIVCRTKYQSGLTLVEFMVSIAIALFLVAGLAVLYANQSTAQKELEKSSRQIENGRYATSLLRDNLQLAGYWGEYGGNFSTPASLPDPCATDKATLIAALALPVQNFTSPTGTLPCGINAANYKAGTDMIVVRRLDTSAPITSNLVVGQAYMQTGLTAGGTMSYVVDIADSTTVKATFNLLNKKGATANLRPFVVHVYYVSPCSVPSGAVCAATDDGGTPIPTLKRREMVVSGGSLTFSTVSLVEGIENLQLDYGLDPTGTGSPSSYTKTPTLAELANVVTVRVNVLARSTEASAGYNDSKTYQLGLAAPVVAPGDQFKRHVFTQLVRLTNISSRRETP